MRRCPVCDFIYEDDERLCAMDGTGLVNHSGPLPFEESASPGTGAPTHSHGSGLTLIAAGIVLAIALFLYFHDIAKRNVLQRNSQGTAKTYDSSRPGVQNPVVVMPVETATPFTTPSPGFNATPPKTNAPTKNHRARQRDDNDPFRAVPVETGTPLSRPLSPLTATRAITQVPSDKSVSSSVRPNPPPPESRPSGTPQRDIKPTDKKKESKVTTFLKKAGRLLKKPFEN